MIEASLANERRQGERRHRRMWSSHHFWLGGRRRELRRVAELGCYTDVYGPGVAVSVIMVMSGCALDALLTLCLLNSGAVEANPLMAATLTFGVRKFVLFKMAVTGISLLLLAIHHRFLLYRWLRVRDALVCLAAGYAALLLYELGLMQLLS